MIIELKIPDVGESIQEVQIGRWLKHEGDRVQADENVVELETDKASLELPSPAAGVIRSILKHDGESAAIGETIARLEPAKEMEKQPPETPARERDMSRRESTTAEKPIEGRRDDAERRRKPAANVDGHQKDDVDREKSAKRPPPDDRRKAAKPSPPVTPSGRRALLEFGLQAEDIQVKGDRIRREDVLRAVEKRKERSRKPEAPAEEAQHLPTEAGIPQQGDRPHDRESLEQVSPMSLIRRRIAARLVEAQRTAALLTTFNEIDMSSVIALRTRHGDAFRKRYDAKLGFMSFFVKAAIEALKDCPELNAEIRGTDIVYRHYFDVGIAVGSERGLVVPVLRRAERMSFAEIERAIADFAARAEANKLTPNELAGGTFTITNGGVFGSLLSTPIVNPPQSGILGMHAIQDRPVAIEGQVVIRPMMYVALTYDHRIVDGREAVLFLRRVKQVIEDPARMLIEA